MTDSVFLIILMNKCRKIIFIYSVTTLSRQPTSLNMEELF